MRVVCRLAVATAVALLLGCDSEAMDAPTGTDAARAADGVTLQGEKWEHNATGGYHFTVPADFNGGIFGGEVGNRLTFEARRDVGGVVSGHFLYEQTFQGETFRFSGRVTCFRVYDTPVLESFEDIPPMTQNRAKWGGVIETSTDPTIPVGTFGWFQSIDNGESGNGPPDLSTLMGIGDEAANEAFCNSDHVPNPLFGPHVVQGSIQVR